MKLLVICCLIVGSLGFKQKLFRRFHKRPSYVHNDYDLEDVFDEAKNNGIYALPEFKKISVDRKKYLEKLMKILYKTGRKSEELWIIYQNHLL